MNADSAAESAALPTREECIAAAGATAACAWSDVNALAAEGGPEAVAEAAWEPGGPSREEIAAKYARMQDDARQAAEG